jgi:hypothetical protein
MNIQNFKTQITEHAYGRLKERLSGMTRENDITTEEAKSIENNLNHILICGFDKNKSFGIKLGTFKINPNSKLLTKKHKSGIYYEINSLDKFDIVLDSTGNEFWGIVRNNRLITVFLRKTVQRTTANQPRNMGGLGVEKVIDNCNEIKISDKEIKTEEVIRYTGKI